jgi:predicted ATPase/class 3 adenylate cyclase
MKAFMFTDIAGSTRLWEEQPERMSVALERHYEILSDSVISGGGSVLKTTGDGMIAVFDTAGQAISASLDAQRSLASPESELGVPLRVRMGIHAGDAEQAYDDYFGPVLNRAARIMAAAHGGQVLASGRVAELVAGSLPAGASLRDLGNHRLRDLTLPERLYQLVHQDIMAEFPPPLTLESSPNNLPLQTTEFLGRRAEINAIQSMLLTPTTRMVTIVGPGGAGKTRLGLQVAAESMDRFRDGASFVDLSAETDPNAAFEAIVRALDIPAASGASPLDALKTRLRDKQMILLLDNFEQITAAAPGVGELLQHCPDLKVLVTSRETLRVRPEHVFPVPPMGLPDPRADLGSIAGSEAVQLFTERARAVRPDFALDSDNAATVARICLRLDGLPLAIELAAARLNLFSPGDLLDRLQERLDILGSGGRDRPDRQRTLWGAIGWSYELLDADECGVFEMMSVFSPTRLEAIEAVAEDALGAVDLYGKLASLVDKSLLKSEDSNGSRRFSMLLTVKEFAAERLADEPDRESRVRRAHARYFRDRTMSLREALDGANRQRVLDDLGDEIGNLRTAWRYWVEQGDVERLFGLLDSLWALHDAKGWYHAASTISCSI